MDELAKAVSELEVRWAQSRLDSSAPVETQSQIGDQLKVSGEKSKTRWSDWFR